MRDYAVITDSGKEIKIAEAQMYRHFKLLLLPVLTEIGMDGLEIAKYDGDIYRLIGLIIANIRVKNSKIEVARKEYRKLREQRNKVFEFIDRFMDDREPIEEPVKLKRVA